MIRTTALPAVLASALLVAAPLAMAAGTAAQSENENTAEHQNPAELAAFQKVKLPLEQAISIGEQHAGGGKATDVSFEEKGSTPAYRVKVYHNSSVWEGLVDANTGNIAGAGTTTPASKLDREDKAELSALSKAKTTLAEAVRKAEQQANGKAIDAGLEERNGKVAYEIEIVKNGAIQPMTVDLATGQVTASGPVRSGSSTPK